MKLWDCFPFFNELELLELRLYELAPVVDGFILVESTHTHQGKPKKLYFDENKSLFDKYNIVHIISEPIHIGDLTDEQVWDNEQHQRNCIDLEDVYGIAMVSDLDEIPSRELVQNLERLPVRIRHRMSYYYLNLIADEEWYGTTIALTSDIERITPQGLRNCKFDPTMPELVGGWHFSYLGGAERIRTKLESFAHSEYNKDEYKDLDHISHVLSEGRDIYNRDKKYYRIDIDDSFPHIVREYPDRYDFAIRHSDDNS